MQYQGVFGRGEKELIADGSYPLLILRDLVFGVSSTRVITKCNYFLYIFEYTNARV